MIRVIKQLPHISFSNNEHLISDAAICKSHFPMSICFSFVPLLGIFKVKCLIGCRFDDPEVQSDVKHFPFKVFQRRRTLYQS